MNLARLIFQLALLLAALLFSLLAQGQEKGEMKLERVYELHMQVTDLNDRVLKNQTYPLPFEEGSIPRELRPFFDELIIEDNRVKVVSNQENHKLTMYLPQQAHRPDREENASNFSQTVVHYHENKKYHFYTTSYYLAQRVNGVPVTDADINSIPYVEKKNVAHADGSRKSNSHSSSQNCCEFKYLDLAPGVNEARQVLARETGLKLDGFEILHADEKGIEVVMFEAVPDQWKEGVYHSKTQLTAKLSPEFKIRSYQIKTITVDFKTN